MGLKYVKSNEFQKGKEDKWLKHKAKAEKEDKKENKDDWRCGVHGNNNEQDDGEWIEVVEGSTNKIIKAATSIPNDNTFISLEDEHGPRQTTTTIHNTTTPIERTYNISERSLNKKGETGSKIETAHAP